MSTTVEATNTGHENCFAEAVRLRAQIAASEKGYKFQEERAITAGNDLAEALAQVERLEGERDAAGRTRLLAIRDKVTAELERDTLQARCEQMQGAIAALVAGDTPLIYLPDGPEADPLIEQCIVCKSTAREFTPLQHAEDCALVHAATFLGES